MHRPLGSSRIKIKEKANIETRWFIGGLIVHAFSKTACYLVFEAFRVELAT